MCCSNSTARISIERCPQTSSGRRASCPRTNSSRRDKTCPPSCLKIGKGSFSAGRDSPPSENKRREDVLRCLPKAHHTAAAPRCPTEERPPGPSGVPREAPRRRPTQALRLRVVLPESASPEAIREAGAELDSQPDLVERNLPRRRDPVQWNESAKKRHALQPLDTRAKTQAREGLPT
jgi:hypothetical protein